MNNAKNLWGLRFLALTLAVVAWFAFSVEQRERLSEKVIEVNVRYDKFPGLIALDRVEMVRIGVRGTVSEMRNLNPVLVDVFVEIPEPAEGLYEVPLTAENVFLPQDLEVVSIEPTIIRLELDKEIDHLLRVEARLEGEPAAGAVVKDPEVIPDLVLVRGPKSRIDALTSVSTTPIDLTGHALDFEAQAAVVAPDPLITVLQPRVVTVRIPLEIPGTGEAVEGTPASQ